MKEIKLDTKLKVKLTKEAIKQIEIKYMDILKYNPNLLDLLIKESDENGYREYSIVELISLFDGIFNDSLANARPLLENDILISEETGYSLQLK